jgi:hypothetical protein
VVNPTVEIFFAFNIIFVDVFFFFLTCPLKMRDGNSNY